MALKQTTEDRKTNDKFNVGKNTLKLNCPSQNLTYHNNSLK